MNHRLKQLRTENGLTQAQVGTVIFANQSMYSRYENGQLDLPLKSAALLARYYNVSVDYLAGLSDIPAPYK